jgi:hypothetical protein
MKPFALSLVDAELVFPMKPFTLSLSKGARFKLMGTRGRFLLCNDALADEAPFALSSVDAAIEYAATPFDRLRANGAHGARSETIGAKRKRASCFPQHF